MKYKRKIWTEAENDFMYNNYPDKPSEVIAQELGRSLKSVYAQAKILGVKKSSEFLLSDHSGRLTKLNTLGEKFRFRKGMVPKNKGLKQIDYMTLEGIERSKHTRFKPGTIPPNTKEKDGIIVIRHGHKNRNEKPYQWTRISLGKWELLHRDIWMKANGKIPKGMIVVFKDGNTMNCVIENLELISFSENMRINSIYRFPQEVREVIRLTGKLKRKIKKHHEK